MGNYVARLHVSISGLIITYDNNNNNNNNNNVHARIILVE
jgi:hypothetical protein